MKAIAVVPGTTNVELIEQPEPQIQNPSEVKLKVIEVGICGTDRELAAGGRGSAPSGEERLIIGHEVLAQVKEVGNDVKNFKVNDLAVVMVRRGCNQCSACLAERADLCYNNNYIERGIKGKHGFQAEYIIDQEQYLVKVPPNLSSCGVLCEPMSVVEKAVEEIIQLQQARLPDWSAEEFPKKQALVIGLGPIGLLACFVLKLRGFKLFGQDIVDSTTQRAKIVEEIGGVYIDGRKTPAHDLAARYGQIDVVIEAAGVAIMDFHLLDILGPNGACVLTGLPDENATFTIEGGRFMHRFVLKNQLLLGSVNASKKHWQLAVEDLQLAQERWPVSLSKLITTRLAKERFRELLTRAAENEIKCLLDWRKM